MGKLEFCVLEAVLFASYVSIQLVFPAGGKVTARMIGKIRTHLVSIQLVFPAGGKGWIFLPRDSCILGVSIQLVFPAGGKGKPGRVYANGELMFPFN